MKIIYEERGKGKTNNLIKIAAKEDAYLVVLNRKEAERIFRESKKKNLKIKYPLTFDEFIHRKLALNRIKIVIDNADLLLQVLAQINNCELLAISLTKEKEGNPKLIKIRSRKE